jgi:hypothetical protein
VTVRSTVTVVIIELSVAEIEGVTGPELREPVPEGSGVPVLESGRP